jgi:hypothetical protein
MAPEAVLKLVKRGERFGWRVQFMRERLSAVSAVPSCARASK